PFKGNRKLRMALSMALDRKAIAYKILHGDEIPAYGWIPTVINNYKGVQYTWANLPDDKRKALARKLYHEEGYSREHPLKSELLYVYSSKDDKRLAIVAGAMWRKVLGAEITLRNQEWKVYLHSIHARRNTEMFIAGWIEDYEDPSTFFSILKSGSAQNNTGYDSPVYDQAVRASEHTPNGDKRTHLMRKAEKTLLYDCPIIPLYFASSQRLIKPYV